jgi:hypothetical protein
MAARADSDPELIVERANLIEWHGQALSGGALFRNV